MSFFLKSLMLVALCVVAVSVAQEPEDEDYDETVLQRKFWVPCDSFTTPKYSCFNCNTRLVCKDYKGKGGELKPCDHPLLPYCNGGFCSPTPSRECQVPVQEPEPVLKKELRQEEESQEKELSEEAGPSGDEPKY